MKNILSTLLLAVTASAQPDLWLVMSNEFGPQFRGVVGQNISSFAITMLYSNELDWNSNLPLRDMPADAPHKIMRFSLDIVNLGWSPWQAGNVFRFPQHYTWLMFHGPCVKDLVQVTISNPDGTIARERLLEIHLMWDGIRAIPGPPKYASPWNAAISPGYGASSGYDGAEYISDTLIDISCVTNLSTGKPEMTSGVYRVQIDLDPMNVYGLFDPNKSARFWIRLNDMDVFPSAAPEEFPAASPKVVQPSWKPANVPSKKTVIPPLPVPKILSPVRK